jgi:cyanophycinase
VRTYVTPSRTTEGHPRGPIIAIGGAEDRSVDGSVLGRFVELAGGTDAKIAVIPTASTLDDTGDRYIEVFKSLGARTMVLPYRERKDAARTDWLDTLERSSGVFMTGGNQLRLSTILGGTPVATSLRRLNAGGVAVAGTSAGAGFLSEHMIAYGDEGFLPRARMVDLMPGLGLTNKIIVDQHFRQRDRLGRMFTALSANPFAVGIGLDEDTAAVIGADDVIEVVGAGTMTVVDPSEVEYSSLAEASDGDPIGLVGIRLHFLLPGWRYDLNQRTATPVPN